MKCLKILFFIFILCSLFLTGCINGTFHVTVNKDGSANLDYKVGLDNSLTSMMNEKENPLTKIKEEAEQQGFTVSSFRENGYTGIEAKKTLANVDELTTTQNNMLKQIDSASDGDFVRKRGFFYDTYQLKGKLDYTKELFQKGNEAVETSGTNGSKSNPFTEMIMDKSDFKILLTLPSTAEKNNASRISGEGPVTYEWDLIPGQNNEIILESKIMNKSHVVLFSSILIFIAILTVKLLRRRYFKRSTV